MDRKENLIRVITFNNPDHVPWFLTMQSDDPYDEGAFQRLPYEGAFPPREGGRDMWGIGWQASDTRLMLPYPVKHPLADLSALDDYLWPDPDDPRLLEPVKREMDPSRLMLGTHGLTLMERAHSLMGMENLFLALMTDPNTVTKSSSRAGWTPNTLSPAAPPKRCRRRLWSKSLISAKEEATSPALRIGLPFPPRTPKLSPRR